MISPTKYALLTAVVIAAAQGGYSHAQAVSASCFSYAYSATAAQTRELLQQAINGFEAAGCPAALRTKVADMTSSSPPSIEGAMHLLYRQSQQRLTAMHPTAPSTNLFLSGPSSSGGASAAYVFETGPGGSIILKQANPSLSAIQKGLVMERAEAAKK